MEPGIVIGLVWMSYVTVQITFVLLHKLPAKNLLYSPYTSIIVASWKEGERVRRCVESLLAQSYPKDLFEIIVIGGGDDESVEILEKYARSHKITFVERRDRSPKWESINIGIKLARGDVLAFIDADCIAPAGWLKRLNENFSGDTMGVVGYAVPISDTNFISKAHWISFPALTMSMNALKFPIHCGACSAFRKQAFTEYGLKFRDSFIEDLVFTLEARKKGVKYVFDNTSFVRHAFPTTLVEYDKGVKRIVAGMLKDLRFHPMIFFNLLMPMISIAYFAITSILSLQQEAEPFSIHPFSFITLLLTCAYAVVIMKKLGIRKFGYLPHFFILTSVASLLYFKNTVRFLLGRKTQWIIYQKA
jgi:cellulose synthase/poly-beta-1,6-N-acetylglucosamine synthase-like glycosyltransferase